MIGKELEKTIRSRLTAAAFLILTLLTLLLSVRHISKSETAAKDGVVARLCSEYLTDPTAIDEYYNELFAYRRSRAGERAAAAREHTEFIETRESVWTDGLYEEDIKIITDIRAHIQKQAGFTGEVDGYIENTEKNRRTLLETGLTEDSFEYRYQELAASLYEKVRDEVELSGEYANGWNDFYTFRLPGLISLLGSIIIGAAAFVSEKESGMLPVIRSSRRGRLATATGKIISVLISSAALTLAVNLASLAAFASAGMLRGAAEPLQAAEAFRKSFLTLSLGEYCVLFFAQRIVAGAVCAAVCMLASVVVYNWLFPFAASAVLTGFFYWLFSAGTSPMSARRYINLFSLADGSLLYSRYNAVNLFGSPVLFSDVCAVLFPAAVAALSALSALIFCRRTPSSRKMTALSGAAVRLLNKLRRSKAASAASKLAPRNLSLFSGETAKAFTFRYAGVAAVVVIAAGLVLFPSSSVFDDGRSFQKKMYEEIMIPEYEGDWTEEKHSEITARLAKAEETIAQYSQKRQAYENGLITAREFDEYLDDYREASLEHASLKLLASHSEYLKTVYEEEGVRGEFFADDGWDAFFDRGPDYYLFAAIIVLASGFYPIEYGTRRISLIIRATKKGRTATFFAKTASAAATAALFALISETVMLTVAAPRLSLSHFSAPAVSMERLSGLDSGLSVAGYLAVFVLTRIAGAALLSLAAAALSGITRSVLAAAAAATAAALLPSVSGASPELTAKIDFMRFFEADRVILFSVSSETLPDFLPLLLITLALAAGTALLTAAAGVRYTSRP